MFHVIHHTDQYVDTTSANRHHPGESVIRFVFTFLAIFIVGAPIWLIFIYQTLSLIMTQFNHANIRVPNWLDNVLVWVLCTPDMHRVHHHYRQPYSDTNYGNIFSFWDRIFGTYVSVNNEKLKYGVDTYMHPAEVNSVWQLLALPFKGYRSEITYEEEERL
jgi:sterol desaturase/sphingolipid hydroxylase (fatty acid hydroxylase superfamily)